MNKEFIERLYGCKACVYDLDKTLVRGRVAKGIGLQFLKKELKRRHLENVWVGIRNYKKILDIAREQGEAEGLLYLSNILGQTRSADEKSMLEFSQRYIEKHSLPGAKKLISHLNKNMPSFISTIGYDISAKIAKEYFGCYDSIGNPVIYYDHGNKNPILKSCEIKMRTGEDKLEQTEMMLSKYGLSIADCFAIGNDPLDHGIMRGAKLSAASPLADEETKRIANYWIDDYSSFLKELKSQ